MLSTGRIITSLICCAGMIAIPVLVFTGTFTALNQLEIAGLASGWFTCMLVALTAGTPDTPESNRGQQYYY